MPTDIYFAGEQARISVDEAPDEVAEAFSAAGDGPLRLTREGSDAVYVNPATVAYWCVSELSPQPEPGEESPPISPERHGVTDIWGRPVRRKPRR